MKVATNAMKTQNASLDTIVRMLHRKYLAYWKMCAALARNFNVVKSKSKQGEKRY